MYKGPQPVPILSQINLVQAYHPSVRPVLILPFLILLGVPSDFFPLSSPALL